MRCDINIMIDSKPVKWRRESGITVDDEATGIRNGGFGSTTEKK